MYCPNCGTENNGNKYCFNCGCPLDNQFNNQTSNQNISNNIDNEKMESYKNTSLICGIVCLVMAFLVNIICLIPGIISLVFAFKYKKLRDRKSVV